MKNLFYIPGLFFAALIFTSCEGFWPNCVDGNGNIITQQRTVSLFDRVQSDGDFDVSIYPGDESSITVEADENLMSLIVTRVYRDELIIETRHGNCLRSTGTVKITVITPDLNGIDLNGSGKIWCDSVAANAFNVDLDGSGMIHCEFIDASSVDFEISGSGTMRANGIFDQTEATIDGSGEMILAGETQSAELNMTGSGKIAAGDLLTNSCNADISGSGSILTWVTGILDVDISGSGNVYYYGEPASINTHISGSGQVIKKQ